jgi:LysR family transcriptional regulator, glycine cleavage system transcriptional activator
MRLPPLNALRAFEAVARHGVLSRAAEELGVTPTAVSRHIKNLEDALGLALFDREAGALKLTSRGRSYARTLTRSFDLMLDATNLLAESAGKIHVTLRAYTTFLVRWLIPQLPDFHARHPDVELHLTTAFDPVDFSRDSVDLGVRYGHGNWPGLDATLLYNDAMVVVGNTAVKDRFAARPFAEALAAEPHLVHTLRLDDWPDWLETAGLNDLKPARRIPLDDMSLIYQGMLDGLGVGICFSQYLPQDLAEGRLHLLSPVTLHRQRGFYLVCPRETAGNPGVAAFIDWIRTRTPSGARSPGQ